MGKRVVVQRDQPRVAGNVPGALIGVGIFFVTLGCTMLLVVAARARPEFVTAAKLLGANFILIGLVSAIGAYGALRRRRLARGDARTEPWHHDHRWDVNGANDETARRGVAALRTCAVLAFFLLPFHIVFATVHSKDRWILFATLALFDLVVGAIGVHGIVLLVKRRKFGMRRVRFSRFPYALNAPVDLTFDGGTALAKTAVSFQLRNVREVMETTGTGRSRRRAIVAELIADTKQVVSTDAYGTARLTFAALPDGEGTDLLGDVPRYWELVASAAVPGLDYEGLFLLPVYAV